jgi:hypothetical protein
LLVCALLLALPAHAFAQSAGDNQYTDPFQGQSQGGGNSGGGGGSSGGGSGNAGTSNQTAQAAPTTSAKPSGTASKSQSTGSQAAQLPRTGFSLALPLVYGFVLLLGGIALRRGARPRIQ